MALGGGTFLTQNKVLPGSYINFVSLTRATATLSDRGIAAIALPLSWGLDDEVFTVSLADFQKNCKKIFGYDYTADAMKGLRDLFLNVQSVHCYKLGTGKKAENTFATAKYSGTRGNDIIIAITAATNVEEQSGWTVQTLLDGIVVDEQTVFGEAVSTDNLTDNDYVTWKASVPLAALSITAGKLSGGSNADTDAQKTAHSTFLERIEPYSFNGLGCLSTDETVKRLYVSFTKRMRDEVGAKFQTIVYRYSGADYEGVVSVENMLSGETGNETDSAAAVYWTTGVIAGCAVNKSNTNKKYDGEYSFDVKYTQEQLEKALLSGKFLFHKVNDDVRVLEDINTLVTTTTEKGDDFKSNQTIRVLDQIANDVATVFNTRYVGVVPNDEAGRVSLWGDIVKLHTELQKLRAIENFESSDIVVTKGDTKKAVYVEDRVTPVNAMAQLYMVVYIA